MKSLVGYVKYRLQLSPTATTRSGEFEGDFVRDRSGRRKTQTFLAESMFLHADAFDFPFGGWVFSQENDGRAPFCPILLPGNLTPLVALADSRHCRLRIQQYSCTRIIFEMPNQQPRSMPALEVHEDGLSLVDEGATLTSAPTPKNNQTIMTLAQISRLEFLEEQGGKSAKSLCLAGYVEAVSPIITVDPNDPFCLVQLKHTTPHVDYSVVVLLRKESLGRWPFLQVGRHAAFCDARRHVWRVPQRIHQKQQCEKMPERVFVVDKLPQVFISAGPRIVDKSYTIPSALTGRVVDIQFACLTKHFITINFLKLETKCSGNNTETPNHGNAFLFLTYFPIDTSLRLTLRVGAEIAGYNLECLENGIAFEATLRSSIVVTKMTNTTQSHVTGADCFSHLCPCAPFNFVRKIKIECLASWHRLQIQHWLGHVLTITKGKSLPTEMLEEEVYQKVFSAKPSCDRIRHPYHDFFHQHKPTESPRQVLPEFVTFEFLKEKGFSRAKDHVTKQMVTLGGAVTCLWTTSSRLDCTEMANSSIYTGGFSIGSSFEPKQSVKGMDLTCGRIVVPTLFFNGVYHSGRSFVLLKPTALVTSVLCLSDTIERGWLGDVDLPCCGKSGRVEPFLSGCSRLVMLGGKAFIFSLAIEGDACMVLDLAGPCPNDRASLETQHRKYCLAQDRTCEFVQEGSTAKPLVSAILSRTKFGFGKALQGAFHGVSLTLSPPRTKRSHSCSSALPISMEVRPNIILNDAERYGMKHILEENVTRTCGMELSDAAASWWKLAETYWTCAVLSVGRTELSVPSKRTRSEERSVLVSFSLQSMYFKAKANFIRLSCPFHGCSGSFLARFVDRPFLQTHNSGTDYSDERKLSLGTLDHLFSRLAWSPVTKAYRVTTNGDQELSRDLQMGISCFSISDLYTYNCGQSSDTFHQYLAPALVCGVQDARFLGVSFCQVFAECRRCRRRLTRSETSGSLLRETENSLQTSTPMLHRQGNSLTERTEPGELSRRLKRRRGLLSCPNGCAATYFGITWELCGTLDDGTAQAMLCADTRASIPLLDLTDETVNLIEEGVWNNEDGIIFSKAVPMKPYVRNAIELARQLARSTTKSTRARLGKKSVLSYLSCSCRAEYLLRSQCQRSHRTSQQLTYFVRPRPLSNERNRSSHSEIFVATECEHCQDGLVDVDLRKRVSYASPFLKLDLVAFDNDILE